MKLKHIYIYSVIFTVAGLFAACGGTSSSPGSSGGGGTTGTMYVYTTGGSSNLVSMYRVNESNGVLIPLAESTVATQGNAFGIAVTPNTNYAYVVNNDVSSVSMYSISQNGILVPLSQESVATQSSPQEIAVTPNGQYAYVTNASSNTISMYSINQDNGILSPLSIESIATGSYPLGIAITPNGNYVYVNNEASSTVSMYSINANGELAPLSPATVPTVSTPNGITINPSGTNAYTVSNDSGVGIGQFSIDANTGLLSPLAESVAGAGLISATDTFSLAMDPSGKYAYVPYQFIYIFTVGSDGGLTFAESTPGTPYNYPHMIVGPLGTYAYSASYGSTVNMFNLSESGALSLFTGESTVPSQNSNYITYVIKK